MVFCMGGSTADIARFVEGLPYLALLICSAGQFIRDREQSRLMSLLAFASASLFLLLRGIGKGLLAYGQGPDPALLLLRLSLVALWVMVYALFLLASDLAGTRRWSEWVAGAWLMTCSLAVLVAPASGPASLPASLALQPPALRWLLWLALLAGNLMMIMQFWRAAARFSGGIRRRLLTISSAGGLLFFGLLLAALSGALSAAATPLLWGERILIALAGIIFLLGFAPPGWLRRFWMLPELERLAQLSSDLILTSAPAALAASEEQQVGGLRQMLRCALNDLGATGGVVQLWNADRQLLEPTLSLLADKWANTACTKLVDDDLLVEAFQQQQATLRPGASKRISLLRRQVEACTMLAAPLVARGRVLGVVGISRAPRTLFVEDDLMLLRRFATQMAWWLISQEQAQLLEHLYAEQARKDEFIGVMAHELRTPLTVLKGRLQLLRRQLNKEGLNDAADAVAKLDSPSTRLGQLISTLLDVSYLDTGRLHVAQHALDLPGLLRKVANEAGQIRVIELRLPGPAEADPDEGDAGSMPMIVLGDSARLEQVFNSLLDNARKYSPEESKIVVQLERRVEKNEALVSVRDFGIGIPSEDQPRLFQRWFRATAGSARTLGGMGLGLYLSAELIRLHKGRLWVESSGIPGEGSTFFVSLPLVSPQAVAGLRDGDATQGM